MAKTTVKPRGTEPEAGSGRRCADGVRDQRALAREYARVASHPSAKRSARKDRGLVRVDVWLDATTAATLAELAELRKQTRAETIRAAISLLDLSTPGALRRKSRAL